VAYNLGPDANPSDAAGYAIGARFWADAADTNHRVEGSRADRTHAVAAPKDSRGIGITDMGSLVGQDSHGNRVDA
jgi:hypothetical protein